MSIAVHLVAHTRRGFRGVVRPASARWLWAHLRQAFPDAFALCLMPDHVHVVAPAGYDAVRWRRVFEHHARIFGAAWDRADPTAISTVAILLRTIRYVLLNPVRDGLVDDPWCWPWSTLRDVGSVIVEPWTREAVLRVSRRPIAVTLDMLTVLDGRHFVTPGNGTPDDPPIASLDLVAAAVSAALRTEPSDITKRGAARSLFVQLVYATGTPARARVAARCNANVHTVARLAAAPDRHALACALRCLQDTRLHVHDIP